MQRKAIVFYFAHRARIAPRNLFGQCPRGSGNGRITVSGVAGIACPLPAEAGERGSPGMRKKYRPDWGGEGRGGELRSFRGMGKGAETPMKAEVGKLKRAVCAAETVRFLFRAPCADRPAELVRAVPARVGKREFHGESAFEVSRNFIASSPAEAGERGSPGMRKKIPPRLGGKVGAGNVALFAGRGRLRKRR